MTRTGHDKTASGIVNWQERARDFQIGDVAYPLGLDISAAGRVVAVYPAIGMIDVNFPTGARRMPAEELQRAAPSVTQVIPPSAKIDAIPGGAGGVPVSGGPMKSAARVARAFVARSIVKNALYWADIDRKYKATKGECDSKSYHCPKCREVALKPAVYRREGGASVRLLGCPTCLFLVEREAILNHHDLVVMEEAV